MKSGALVIASDRYIATGIVRSLGRHGISTWTLHSQTAPRLASRYVHRSLYWPSGDEAHRITYLEELAVKYSLNGWVLFGTADHDVKLIGTYHDRLAKQYRLTSSKWTDIAWAYDKKLTYQLASDLRLDHPWTICLSSRTEVEELICEYPVILKPSVKELDNRFTRERAWRVNSHSELLARFDEARRLTNPDTIMIQEWIPGGGETRWSFGAICDRGRPLGMIVVQQLRQYPNEFGRSSTFVQTLDCPQVESAAQCLIRSTNYSGFLEAEYKLDTRSGEYKLLDVNPRLWGWHSIGVLAGVDFPYLQWKHLAGEAVAQCKGRIGVRWIRMSPDLRGMFDQIRRGTFSIREYRNSLRAPVAFAIFAVDDLLPAFFQLPLLLFQRVSSWVWRRK